MRSGDLTLFWVSVGLMQPHFCAAFISFNVINLSFLA